MKKYVPCELKHGPWAMGHFSERNWDETRPNEKLMSRTSYQPAGINWKINLNADLI